MTYYENETNKIVKSYPKEYSILINYFNRNKKQYFIEGNYIRSNSYLERYNEEIKSYFGNKKGI